MAIGIIEVNKLKVRAFHGVMEQERISGNLFEVTVHLQYPIDKAMVNDNVSSTLNYADVIDVIKAVMAEPSNLLEHVAGRMKSELTKLFPGIRGGVIRIAKLTPPINCEVSSVAVTYRW